MMPLNISHCLHFFCLQYAHWFKRECGLDAAVDLASFAFTLLAANVDPLHESPAPLSEASRALQVLLSVSPEHFSTDAAIDPLIGTTGFGEICFVAMAFYSSHKRAMRECRYLARYVH